MKIEGNTQLLSLNQSYSTVNDPCLVHKCMQGSKIIEFNIECITICDDDQMYQKVKNQCCGQCVSRFCVDEKGIKFKPGDTWKSPDNCTINECIDDETEFRVISYQKTCPKLQNCPISSIEIRDCCQYCNYTQDRKF
mgnify:CR=1 FL=1